MSELTYQEWETAIAEAMEGGDPEGKTAKEIAANRGWSVLRTLSVLEQLKAAGRVRAVQVRRTCLDDVSRLRAGYVLVKR